MNLSHASIVSLLACGALSGCAAQNYDFSRLPDGQTRIDRLVEDLDGTTTTPGEDDALYDFSVVPLIHSRVHVFEKSDDEDSPAGYVEADIESSFPLFGFVDGEVTHYDEQRRLVTRHEFGSALWGAFADHRETVVTIAGTRERTRHTFLWLFGWDGEERWTPAEVTAASGTATSSNPATP